MHTPHRWLIFLLLLTAVSACRQAEPVTRTVAVAPATVDCVGVVPQQCLLVSTDVSAGWQYWYDPIEGFNFEPGSYYVLQVIETEVEDAPADASVLRWTLEAVLGQEPAAIRTAWVSSDLAPCPEMADSACFQVWDAERGVWEAVSHDIEGFVPPPGLATQLTYIDRQTDGVWTTLQVLAQAQAPPTPVPTPAPTPTAGTPAEGVIVDDVTALTFQPVTLPALGISSVVPLHWAPLTAQAWSGDDGFVNLRVEPGASARAAVERLVAAVRAVEPAAAGEIGDQVVNGRNWTLYTRTQAGQQLTVAATAVNGSVVLISLAAPPAQHAAILQAMLDSFVVGQ